MAKTPSHYLVKSEPFTYSFAQLVRDGRTRWDGVRNFEARNNLRAMHVGDLLLFYHSSEGKQIVGIAQVVTAAYPDPTAPGEDWSAVDVAPVVELAVPVTLATIKAEPRLAEMALVRKSRISVVPVTRTEFALLLRMGGTKLPATAPGAAPRTAPDAAPRTTPGAAPRTTPGGTPRIAPRAAPRTTPGAAPRTTSEAAPRTAPRPAARPAARRAAPRGKSQIRPRPIPEPAQ